MDALVVTVENEILKVSYDRSHYELIEEAVGGNFEVVRPRLLQRPYCMMVNEDGLLYGFPRNSMVPSIMASLSLGISSLPKKAVLVTGWI